MAENGGRKPMPATAAAIAAGHRRRSGISSAAAAAAVTQSERNAQHGTEHSSSSSLAEAGRSKYGKLLSTGSGSKQQPGVARLHVDDKVADGSSLVSHSSEEGRQKLLYNHLHEVRRFDSADYFTGHLPEEILAGHIGESDDEDGDVQNTTNNQNGNSDGQTTSPRHLAAKQRLLSHEGRRRFDSADHNMLLSSRQAMQPSIQVTDEPMSSTAVAKRMLMANKRSAPARAPAPRATRQNSNEPRFGSKLTTSDASRSNLSGGAAPQGRYGNLGIAAGRQVMLRRALKEKPNLQRWDSGEYFQQHQVPHSHTEQSTAGSNSDESPSVSPSHGVGNTNLNPFDQGRQMLLARKLKEVKRFDSGDYFRGLSQSNVDDGASSLSSMSATEGDGAEYTGAFSPLEPADDYDLESSAARAALRGQRAVAQRRINDRHQRWDSADYSMGNLPKSSHSMPTALPSSMDVSQEDLPQPPQRRFSGSDRAERRMQKYGKLSARPKQALPP